MVCLATQTKNTDKSDILKPRKADIILTNPEKNFGQ